MQVIARWATTPPQVESAPAPTELPGGPLQAPANSPAPIGEAADILWTYTSPELYDLLAHQRGWPPEQYGRFVGQTLIVALLPPKACSTDPTT